MTDTLTFPVNQGLTAETPSRTIAGVVLPWDSPGRTSAGELRAVPGSIRLPADLSRVKLYGSGHDRETPVAYCTGAQVTAEGLHLTFKVAPTPAGDQALAEALARVRDAFSVELDDLELDGDRLIGGRLTGVALVTVPAFPDARITQVAAAAVPPEVTAMPTMTTESPEVLPDQPEEDQPEQDTEDTEDTPDAGAGHDTLAAAARPPSLTAGTRPRRSLSTLYQAMSGLATDSLTPELSAALQDITHTANAWVQPTQYEGQLWSGVVYQRRIVPLLTQRPLTSFNVTGWRWVTKPAVAPYAGDKAAVPSNAAVTESESTTAQRLAGAHDIDRKFRDFGDTAFFQSYYEAMTESWAMQSDAAAAAFLVANATAMTGTGADLFMAALLATIQVQADTGAPATFALANPADWVNLFTIPVSEAPAYAGLGSFTVADIVPSPLVPAGKVIVGARGAVSWYERAGSPIRVETVNLANGGIDGGVFGYYATMLNDAKGLVSNTVTPPVARAASSSRAK